uniref:Uncharacterized protein n=1 Tax=Anguilla anguilla TaxID=7936 RepID=A0A0E9QBD4_ANGAN
MVYVVDEKHVYFNNRCYYRSVKLSESPCSRCRITQDCTFSCRNNNGGKN